MFTTFLFTTTFASLASADFFEDLFTGKNSNIKPAFDITGPFTDDQGNFLMSICDYDVSKEAKCLLSDETSPEFKKMYDVSRAALRLSKKGRPHCTGWLVGDEGHILTNNHCIANQREADAIIFEAMAEGANCTVDCASSLACGGEIIHEKPVQVIHTGGNTQKDYTLLQLPEEDRKAAVEKYGFLRLRRSGPVVGERIYIAQHPAGWGKRIATNDGDEQGTIMDIDHYTSCGRDQVGWNLFESEYFNESKSLYQVTYRLDTMGGSSGSPVISAVDHAVVAIHHCGGCSLYANTATNLMLYLEEFEEFLPASAIV